MYGIIQLARLASMHLRTRSAHLSASSSISLSKKRNTVQPCRANWQFTRLSLSIFAAILSFQNAEDRILVNCSSQLLKPRFSHPRPCQKSPSQNTAIFGPINAKSGVPVMPLTCFLYLSPLAHIALASTRSALESFDLTARIILDVVSRVLGFRCLSS